MNSRAVFRVLGFVSAVVGMAMLAPAVLSFFQPEDDVLPYLISAGIPLVLGVVMLLSMRAFRVRTPVLATYHVAHSEMALDRPAEIFGSFN